MPELVVEDYERCPSSGVLVVRVEVAVLHGAGCEGFLVCRASLSLENSRLSEIPCFARVLSSSEMLIHQNHAALRKTLHEHVNGKL